MLGQSLVGASPPPATHSPWRTELIATIRLALPMALTQLGQIAMMTTDMMLIGRLGEHMVAAAALGHTLLFSAFVIGTGIVSAVAPLAAQAYGAREPRMVRRSVRVGLWAAIGFGIPLSVVQLYGEAILIALGQDAETARLAETYLTGLAWSLTPAWCFIALRSFMGAVNRPEPALWIILAAIPANALLAYALINGAFGLPRLELLGAGIATTIVNLAMCAVAVWVAYACHPFRKYRILGRFWRPDWSLLRRLLAIGAPVSGMLTLEYGVFAGAAMLMGWLGTVELAAHQIALQTAAILFMAPLGIGIAASVRVGHAAGRRDPEGARRAGFTAFGIGAVFAATMTLIVIATRDQIPLAFLGTSAAHGSATAALASSLLVVGATFFIADGLQTIGAGALRGLQDTRVPFLYSAISFWLIGFTACYALGFPLGLGAFGIWIGLSLGLIIYAALLVVRFHRLTARGYLPPKTTPDGKITV